jgi:hypothetical protein
LFSSGFTRAECCHKDEVVDEKEAKKMGLFIEIKLLISKVLPAITRLMKIANREWIL